MDFKIRKASKKDLSQYMLLRIPSIEEYWSITGKNSTYDPKSFETEFDEVLASNQRMILVVEKDKKLVGYLLGEEIKNPFKHFGYIDDIFVSKDFRGNGLGAALLKEFMNLLRLEGIKKFRLGVSIKNKVALEIYQRLGFTIDYYEMEYNDA